MDARVGGEMCFLCTNICFAKCFAYNTIKRTEKIQEKYAQKPFVSILNAFLLWFISFRLTSFTLVTIVIIGNWMSITGDIELTSNSLNYCALKAHKMNKSTETHPHPSRVLSVPTDLHMALHFFLFCSTVRCSICKFKIALNTRTFYSNLNGNNRSLRHFKK